MRNGLETPQAMSEHRTHNSQHATVTPNENRYKFPLRVLFWSAEHDLSNPVYVRARRVTLRRQNLADVLEKRLSGTDNSKSWASKERRVSEGFDQRNASAPSFEGDTSKETAPRASLHGSRPRRRKVRATAQQAAR